MWDESDLAEFVTNTRGGLQLKEAISLAYFTIYERFESVDHVWDEKS